MMSDLCSPAFAQTTFPSRPITVVVPFAPGGNTDVVARRVAERMSESLGKPVSIDNRPGANTIIGAEMVARAQPDGHTLLLAVGTTLTSNPLLFNNLPYKIEDFAAVALLTVYPFAIVARKDGPRSIQELADAARARPGAITYGTNGPTTTTNIAMLMVLERMGVEMQDVTYRGDAAALNDFLAGNLDLLVVTGTTALPAMRNGQGRILGWTSAERLTVAPEVPTFAETYPGLDVQSWTGLIAPARTPRPIVEQLNNVIVEAVRDPRFRDPVIADGNFIRGDSPAQFDEFLKAQAEIWRPATSRLLRQ